jgi:hypothetical protein
MLYVKGTNDFYQNKALTPILRNHLSNLIYSPNIHLIHKYSLFLLTKVNVLFIMALSLISKEYEHGIRN